MKNNAINLNDKELEEIGKKEMRLYKAEWRRKNRDKVRESNKRYWIKRALLKRSEKLNDDSK